MGVGMMQVVGMADTGREELRGRIDEARRRFVALAVGADPTARVLDGTWSVQQMVAHVVSVADRYCGVASGDGYRQAERPRDLDRINDEEVSAALAPVPSMLERLEEVALVMADFFDRASAESGVFPFHGGVEIDCVAGQTNWLGELLIHGRDIARAVGAPWELSERDMLLVLSGMQQMASAYLHRERARGRRLVVALDVPDARPWVLDIRDGDVQSRPRTAGDRPDAVLRSSATTMALVLYQRLGNLGAMRRGLMITGGRRPWVALGLQRLFEKP